MLGLCLPLVSYVIFDGIGQVAVGPGEELGAGGAASWVTFFLISSVLFTISGIGALIATCFLTSKGSWKNSSLLIKIGYISIWLSLFLGILLLSASWFN